LNLLDIIHDGAGNVILRISYGIPLRSRATGFAESGEFFGGVIALERDHFSAKAIFESLRGRLIVSCQAAEGDPMDDLDTLRRMAASVLRGGASGLRAEGVERIRAFRAMTEVPIVGIIKKYDASGEVYITPDFASAQAVSGAGADIVALDCTTRRLREVEPWPELIARIHGELGRVVMADIATVEEAVAAEGGGADAVASTLYGYTAETAGARTISWELIAGMVARVKVPVIVEGHVTRPDEVRRALEMGACAVAVGSAITRPQTITERFVRATG
jgi:N-acylglucosamine-6-phosphate 2-epimerase